MHPLLLSPDNVGPRMTINCDIKLTMVMKPIHRDVIKLTKVSIPSIMKGPFEGLLLPSLDNVGPGVTILRC